ncbi:MAG: hypothetical protein V1789_03230 [PVC group bacterium]
MKPKLPSWWSIFFFLLSVCDGAGDTVCAGTNPLTGFETRSDGATRITDALPRSCQNPVFSPDSQYILFTRFINGYNDGPSELVRIRIDATAETVIVSSADADNVNVPFGSWASGKICWASDRGGGAEEVFVADEDGTNIRQVTDHPTSQGYYIEPVFNPADTNKILFEISPSDSSAHLIALVERDKGDRVTILTGGTTYDDRLPSWSRDGSKILFQRTGISGPENWEIYTAAITLGDSPCLSNYVNISNATSQETDNSWSYLDTRVLSSSDYGNLPVPNIYAFPSSGAGRPRRVTYSNVYEDGAPAYSPDGKWIAFESHSTVNEDSPSAIWIIPARPTADPISFRGGDYTGDGTSDIAVFRPVSGLWAVRGISRAYFGGACDLPKPGDYDGDGTGEAGIFRPEAGLWAIRGVTRCYYGSADAQPVPGDYNGDRLCDLALFRWGAGLWAVRGITRGYFGSADDQPVSGDYNGDGTLDPAIFRPLTGLWAIRKISRFYFGAVSDGAFPGDYNGDGTAEAAVFRGVSGLWAVRGVTRRYFGAATDHPVPADYNGNGGDDIGIFRASSGLWAVRGISRVYFGAPGDLPVTR